MFDEPLPSKKDLDLLMKLKKEGDTLVDDLFGLFSYHRPKEYKLYSDNFTYNPLDKGKIILDLIFTIRKYNKLIKKELEVFQEKGKKSKYFTDLYKGSRNMGKSVTAKTCREIVNNLIPKYERKHLRFENNFLEKNIFAESGLLPSTLGQGIKFFDKEIKAHGMNSYRTIKYIKFIEKLYKNIQKTFTRQTINSTFLIYENQKEKMYQKKQELINQRNMERMRRKEIRLDKKEIANLKMLNDIAEETYEQIMESINKRVLPKKIFKIKSKSKSKSKSKKKEINSSKEKEKEKIKEDNIKFTEKLETKTNESKFNTKYNEKYNRTLSMERMKMGTMGTGSFFNNHQVTTTTKYLDSNNNTMNTNFTLNNTHKDLINKLNKLKMRKEKEEKEKLKLKPLPIYTKTFSRNKSEKTIFPSISQKIVNVNQNKLINLQINPVLNSATSNQKILKPSESSPLILKLDTSNESNSVESNKTIKEIKEIKEVQYKKIKKKKKKKILRKKVKKSKLELLIEYQKKVPIIYEQLRKIKNLLNMSRKEMSKSKAFELFCELYGKKKVSNINEKKAPKELYNSYINMKMALDRRSKEGNIFKKYIGILDKSFEDKIEKNKEQDENLKSKYYDLVQVLIKKKLEDEKEKYL